MIGTWRRRTRSGAIDDAMAAPKRRARWPRDRGTGPAEKEQELLELYRAHTPYREMR